MKKHALFGRSSLQSSKRRLLLSQETVKLLHGDQLSLAAGGCPSGQTSQSSETISAGASKDVC